MSHRALGEQFRHVVITYPDGTYSSKQVAQQDIESVTAPAKSAETEDTGSLRTPRFVSGAKQKAQISVQPIRRDTRLH